MEKGGSVPTTGRMEKSTAYLGVDEELLTVLAREHCRSVLRYFDHYSTGVATIDDLVRFVRERTDRDGGGDRLGVHLHHLTLPRLVEADVVEYDPRSRTVRYRGHPAVEAWVAHEAERAAAPK